MIYVGSIVFALASLLAGADLAYTLLGLRLGATEDWAPTRWVVEHVGSGGLVVVAWGMAAGFFLAASYGQLPVAWIGVLALAAGRAWAVRNNWKTLLGVITRA